MSSGANAKTNAKAAPLGAVSYSFLQEVDDLVSFLALVLAAGDVYPVDVAVGERSD